MAVLNTIRAWNSFVLIVDVDPSIPPGVEAGVDSIAVNTNGAIYVKTGIADTAWTLEVTPSAGTTPIVEYRTISVIEGVLKQVTLSNTPTDSALVQLDVISGGPQEYGFDYQVVGTVLSWNGKNLDGVLAAGNKLRIAYFTF